MNAYMVVPRLHIEFKHITWRVYVIKKSPTILHFKLTLVPEAFFYSFLANSATRTASFIFFFWLARSALGASIVSSQIKKKDNIKRKPLGPGYFKLNVGNKLIDVTEVENKSALSHRINGYR